MYLQEVKATFMVVQVFEFVQLIPPTQRLRKPNKIGFMIEER
jgi:hypothetical protein